ncbi:MAG: ArsJ-associated glyceraldehyde-3-phosphate dehydrogenase [Planctomycetes bacterium]|nr:ArsJ-associated glyceraldehyde-3-phosphate dehydrogenase [Planctomycetota bacterium]
MKVGINGFGRMGRLALRAGWQHEDLEFVAVNEPAASAENMALLLEFDSVQGRWDRSCSASAAGLVVDESELQFTAHDRPGDIPWKAMGVDLVLECTGQFRTSELLEPHLQQGAKRIVVSAPVADGPPNIVVGVNHGEFDLGRHAIVTAASCTTNCLAPIVKVIHDGLGIERGSVTTLHNPTNTQSVHDAPHKDPRRARASQINLIPTSTNSATAVTLILPELKGRLDSIAVRVPVLNASLVDCAFHVSRETTPEEVNALLRAASEEGPLVDILGFETRPLVSSDYARDKRSGIVDAGCTRVIDGRLVKVMAWYDNEWGYANRMVELAGMVARAGQA